MDKMMKVDVDERVKSAVDYFESGYTCAQSVVLAFTDLFGIEKETALKFAGPFGGGMGRLREVCGAVSGMFMILGWLYPYTEVEDREGKKTCYAAVQRCAQAFKEMMGSYICAELLQIRRAPQEAVPSERTPEYYAQRPCSRSVAAAALILCREINS